MVKQFVCGEGELHRVKYPDLLLVATIALKYIV